MFREVCKCKKIVTKVNHCFCQYLNFHSPFEHQIYHIQVQMFLQLIAIEVVQKSQQLVLWRNQTSIHWWIVMPNCLWTRNFLNRKEIELKQSWDWHKVGLLLQPKDCLYFNHLKQTNNVQPKDYLYIFFFCFK